jgi:hypothetical protein
MTQGLIAGRTIAAGIAGLVTAAVAILAPKRRQI